MHTPVKPNLATMPVRGLLLDMDGVLYHGERPIAEAMEFLAALAYLPRACITNNPIASAAQVAARLSAMGFPETRPELILTSAEATAQWLRQQRPGFRYYAVGAPGLHLALSAVGVADAEQADFVVIGEGAGIDFDAITIGVNLIVHGGARLICTNPDHSVDTTLAGRRRILPGGG
jgi:ribonucleotide monophosphatase NagD (HAD superfamily)